MQKTKKAENVATKRDYTKITDIILQSSTLTAKKETKQKETKRNREKACVNQERKKEKKRELY